MKYNNPNPLQVIRDIFGPNRYELKAHLIGRKAPFVIICPGGGYQVVMSSIEGIPYAKALNAAGYHAFILRYHTKDKARHPQALDDLAQALTYLLENAEQFQLDKERYSIWGSSAGGHLAASFGCKDIGYASYQLPKPSNIVLSYPVITMGDMTHQDSRKQLLGNHPSQEEIDLLSVEKHIWSGYPPTFIWNSKEDRIVDPINAQLLVSSLEEIQVPHCFIQYPSGKHGNGLAKGTVCQSWFNKAVSFMEEHWR